MIAGNRPHPLLQMLGGLALLAIIVAAGLYLAGWLMVRTDSDSATLELRTAEMKQAADEAVDQGEALLKDAVEPSSAEATPAASREAAAPAEDSQGPVLR